MRSMRLLAPSFSQLLNPDSSHFLLSRGERLCRDQCGALVYDREQARIDGESRHGESRQPVANLAFMG